MTPERITLAGLVLSFLGKVVADWMRSRARDADREARERKEDVDRQARAESWLRAKVDELVEHEREVYRVTLDDLRSRITKLETDLATERAAREAAEERLSLVPELAEDLARALSRVDPNRTPTAGEIDHLRRAGAAIGLPTHTVNGLVIGRAT